MVNVIEDRVRDTSTSTGTGTVTVSGSPPLTYRTFASVASIGDTFPYAIVSRTLNEWEVGMGAYSASNQFTRTPLRSSNSNNAVNFSAGTKDVILSMNAAPSRTPQGAANVLAYGADPAGVADSATAFTNAWAESPLIYAPRGKYKIGSSLTVPSVHGAGLIGDGAWFGADSTGAAWTANDGGTLLSFTPTTGNAINGAASQIQHAQFRGFALLRPSQATNGYGLDLMTVIHTSCYLDDLHFSNHNIGLGITGYGTYNYVTNILSEINRLYGFYMAGQLQTDRLFAFNNVNTGGTTGFFVDAAGRGQTSNGQWKGLASVGSQYGLHVQAASALQSIEALRISDSFFDGAASGGPIVVESYAGSAHRFTNVGAECSGVDAWQFTANNPTVILESCYGTTTGAFRGLGSAAPCTIVGGGWFNNGSPSGTSSGIGNTGSGKLLVRGVQAANFTYGVNGGAGSLLSVHGCDLAGCTNQINGVGITGGVDVILAGTYAVSALPAAGTVGAGAKAVVNDSNAAFGNTTVGNTVAGGGSNKVPVFSDGSNWKIG